MKKLLLLIILAVGINFIAAQQYLLNENFDGTAFPPSGWVSNGAVRTSSQYHSSPYSVQITSNPSAPFYLQTPLLSYPHFLQFYIGKFTAQVTFSIEISKDETNWQEIFSANARQGWNLHSIDLSSYTNIYVRILNVDAQRNKSMHVDDVTVTQRVPSITLSSSSPSTDRTEITPNDSSVLIYRFTLTASNSAAALNQLTFTTSGTYIPADVRNFKLWYNSINTLSGARQIGTITTSLGTGTHTFSSINYPLGINSHGYFFITLDASSTIVDNHTIYVNALTPSNLTFASGTATGTAYDGDAGIFKNGQLPVELSSLTAAFTQISNANMYVSLQWTTQSETGLAGYYIYRGTNNDLSAAEQIPSLIAPANSSHETSYEFIDREIQNYTTYYYWLQSMEMDGSSDFHGPVSVSVNGGDNNHTPNSIMDTKLLNAYPNPFFPNTTLCYTLKERGQAKIEIYNVRGQLIRSFMPAPQDKGYYQIVWDGKDLNGTQASSGVYYVRMTCGKYVSSQRIVLMK